MSVSKYLLIFGLALVIVGAGLLYLSRDTARAPAEPIPEPETSADPDWSRYADDTLSFRYPAELPTEFMRAVEWPPRVTVGAARACEAESGVSGETKEIPVNGRTYCVTTTGEGAAGSVYTEYAYSMQQDGRTITLAFTIRAPQCGNYDDPQRTACEQERASFDVDALANRIFQTIEVE